MLIATWNVNSVKQRLEHLKRFIGEAEPDVVCLQELKCQTDAFPAAEIEAAGYSVAVAGQKAFNGVAMLSKTPLREIRHGLPGDEDDVQARYLEAAIHTDGAVVRIASIYLPNGNPLGTDKWTYKLAWMRRLERHAAALLALEQPLVLAGDYNVIPDARDVDDPAAWLGDALYQPESRGSYRRLLGLGLTDALRASDDRAGLYTFWDYQAGAWQRNKGIRIDHLLLSPAAADKLQGVTIHKETRGWDKPSDHVPVSVSLAL